MEIKEDVSLLISSVEASLFKIKDDASKGFIDKVLLKNTLENIRSALDYCAIDVHKKLVQASGVPLDEYKVYFPYGKNLTRFKDSLKKSLPDLDKFMPNVFSVISAEQVFNSGGDWILKVCELTNEAKHRKLNEVSSVGFSKIKAPGFSVNLYGNSIVLGNSIDGKMMDDFVFMDGDIAWSRENEFSPLIVKGKKLFLSSGAIDVDEFFDRAFPKFKNLCINIYEKM